MLVGLCPDFLIIALKFLRDKFLLILLFDCICIPFKDSEAGPSHTNWASQFVAMGFSEELVVQAIKQNSQCLYSSSLILKYHLHE